MTQSTQTPTLTFTNRQAHRIFFSFFLSLSLLLTHILESTKARMRKKEEEKELTARQKFLRRSHFEIKKTYQEQSLQQKKKH